MAEMIKEAEQARRLKLSDFCNMAEFEKILSDWSITADMSAIVRDTDHHYITEKHGFTDFCETMLSSEKGNTECRSCSDNASLFCCHAGLCDFSLPVTLPDGQTIAYVFCGQTRLAGNDEPDFHKLAADYRLDEDILRREFSGISLKSREKIEAAKALLSSSVNSFVAKSYENRQSTGESHDDRTLSQITQILYAYNITLDPETGKYTLITGTGLERLVSIYKKNTDYKTAQTEVSHFVHPGYIKNLYNLLNTENLRQSSVRTGHIDTVEFPVIYPDAENYEWHEVNVFASRDNHGKPIINILGRDVTEAHNLQEKNNREIRAAAARNQILSDLTKMLYSYNITLNLNTGKYTLIEGTGMTKFMEIFKSTNDYITAYEQKIRYILPDSSEQFAAIASIEALRGHRSSHGFIGSLEYGADTDHGEEWHEINVFISTDELGNPIANILGRDITETHKRQELREISQKAAAARDQLLSGVTKMLYSFNITVNLNTWRYTLITGTGCEEALAVMQASDDAVLTFNRLRNMLDEESRTKIDSLFGVSALNSFRGRSGFIGTIITSGIVDGRKQWQEINLFMGTNEYGEPTANILGRDITESQLRQEERENELRASAAKDQILSEITKSLYSFNITVNLKTGKYSLITGTGMDDFVSLLTASDDFTKIYTQTIDSVPPEFADAYKDLIHLDNLRQKASMNGHVGQLEYAVNVKSGTEWHEINVFISSDENGDALANILGRDVTETHMAQERRERELRAASARDQLLSDITKMLYSYNMTINLNTGKYTLITGTGLDSIVHDMENTDDYSVIFERFRESVVPAYLEHGEAFLSLDTYRDKELPDGYIGTEELPEMTNNGIEWHEINIFAGFDDNGNPVINLLGRDVTDAHDRADTKAKLEIAEASSKSKTQFLFNMSHDIRTPMNAIIGFTDLLQKHLDDRELAEQYIGKIKYSNEFLLSLINNVLEMARIESGKETLDESPYDVYEFNDSLEAVFASQMQEKGLNFSINSHVEHATILGDKTKSKEIFLNILSNALKYTPAGGSVTFDTYELPSDLEGYALYKNVISDTGIGMSKEFLPHLFDEFTRERNSTESRIMGTGLGMSIVRNLVDLMQGTIEVESELGKGTTFIITIPHRIISQTKAEEEEEEEKSAADIDFEGRRILLAEDNDLNAEIAMEILGEVGFKVDRAADGVICVDMLQKAPEHYYDVILMDIQMPNMNGYDATRVIRAMNDPGRKNIPVIAMTANAFDEDKKNALAAGMNAHLAKPIEIPKLMTTLSAILK